MLQSEPPPARVRTPRSRRGLTVFLVVAVVLFLSLQGLATLWTDLLWFQSLELETVWSKLLVTRVGLAAGASLVAFAVLWVNLIVADRLSPRINLLVEDEQEEMLERFNEWVEPRVRRLRLVVAAVFGLLSGLGASAWTFELLRFFNAERFGFDDPVFGLDIGFYVFRLPFLRDLTSFFFQLLILATLLTLALHYLNGGIRLLPGRPPEIGPGVKAHISVLLAGLALVKAGSYRLDTYELLYSPRGSVLGASYTDVVAQRPALNLLTLIAFFGAALLVANIWRRGWVLPGVAVVSWLVVSLIVGGIIPAFVQRFQVVPDEINKEIEYVGHNITFTREAYGLSDVEVRPFAARQDIDASDLVANQETIDNLRLWDPAVLQPTYKNSQALSPFYQFGDVDVDRYVLDGKVTQVELAARELDSQGDPTEGWINSHLVFTHGFGAVVSAANDVTAEGKPDYLVKDIPPQSLDPILDIEQPRLYFGEELPANSFVIARTNEREVDRPVGEGTDAVEFNSYDGNGGVQVRNVFRRAAFALRFSDFNTLISGQVTGESRVLLRRNVVDRLATAAPFLSVDSDPYLVILDGRLVWVLDMYTTSAAFPYSQPADVTRLRLPTSSAALPNRFNYIRNSVKATVDAYDGTVDFYIVDEGDPLIRSYRAIFPALFKDRSQMPEGLEEHFRYPEDLFRVQSEMFRDYHVTDPRVFFNDSDPWDIALDPSTSPTDETRGIALDADGRPLRQMMPYYLLMRLPGEDDLSFLMMQPYTPKDKANMISFLIAKSDPGAYGEIVAFQLPRDRQFDGPGLVGQDINQDSEFSSLRTLLGQEGSDFIQGQMLVVPIEESILFVQPIYLQGEQAQIPEFKNVVVVFGEQIVIGDTLDGALTEIFADFVPDAPPGDEPTEPTGPVDVIPGDVANLLDRAAEAFAEAQAALQAGDLGTYQAKTEEAAALIEEARRLLESEAGSG